MNCIKISTLCLYSCVICGTTISLDSRAETIEQISKNIITNFENSCSPDNWFESLISRDKSARTILCTNADLQTQLYETKDNVYWSHQSDSVFRVDLETVETIAEQMLLGRSSQSSTKLTTYTNLSRSPNSLASVGASEKMPINTLDGYTSTMDKINGD